MAYAINVAKCDTIGESQFNGESAGTFVTGLWGYLDDATNRMMYAANTAEATADVYGICQSPSKGPDMPLCVVRSGAITVDLGADRFPGPGVILFLGPDQYDGYQYSELASSAWITVLGYSTGLRTMMIDIRATGQQKP